MGGWVLAEATGQRIRRNTARSQASGACSFYAQGTVYTKPRGSYPFNNAITYQFHANAVPENP